MRSIATTFGPGTVIALLTLAPIVLTQSVESQAGAVDRFGHAVEPEITITEIPSARPGASVPLAVHVRSPAGLHLLPVKPDDPYLVSTTLALEGTRELAIVGTEWPETTRVSPQGTSVLPAEFDVHFTVRVGSGVLPGSVAATIRMRFQQCDVHGCYIPHVRRLPVVVPIAGGAR